MPEASRRSLGVSAGARALAMVAVTGLTAGCVAGSAGPARAANPLEIGVQDDAVFLARDGYSPARAYTQARAVGATRLRIGMTWHQAVRRRRGSRVVWAWRGYDRVVNEARRNGMRVQLTLTGTPAFDSGGDRYLTHRRPLPRRMALFAAAAARHFRGRVDRYSIWNEPNSAVFLTQSRGRRQRAAARSNGAAYRRLYVAGSRGVKAADPNAQVLMGETAPSSRPGRVAAPLAFLREVACVRPDLSPARACPPLAADGYAHHPYQFRAAPEQAVGNPDEVGIAALPRLRATLEGLAERGALLGADGRPLDVYVTEFGYFDPRSRRGVPSEATRAQWLPRAFEVASSRPWVREMVYYHLITPPRRARWDTGIVGRSGRVSRSFVALRDWSVRRLR